MTNKEKKKIFQPPETARQFECTTPTPDPRVQMPCGVAVSSSVRAGSFTDQNKLLTDRTNVQSMYSYKI